MSGNACRRVVQRRIVGDVERLRVGSPGSRISHSTKGRNTSAVDRVEIEELTCLIVDKQLRIIRRDSKNHARHIGILRAERVGVGAVNHQFMRRTKVKIGAKPVHDHRVWHIRHANRGANRTGQQLHLGKILRLAGRREPCVVAGRARRSGDDYRIRGKRKIGAELSDHIEGTGVARAPGWQMA